MKAIWATATETHSFRLAYGGPHMLSVDERVNTIEDNLTGDLSYVRPEVGGARRRQLGFGYKSKSGGFDLLAQADGRLTLVSNR